MNPLQDQLNAKQVAEALIGRIAEGKWGKSKNRLPEIPKLAEELNASEATVMEALEQLLSEKLISRRSGDSFTVTDVQVRALSIRFSNLIEADGTPVTGEVLRTSMEKGWASDLDAERLRLKAGEPVCRINRLRGRDGSPFMVEVATLPLELFPGLSEQEHVPFRTPILCRRYGITVRHAKEHVSLAAASADIAVALGVGYGTPLFVLERVLYSADGRALEFRVGHTLMTNLRYVASWSAGDR